MTRPRCCFNIGFCPPFRKFTPEGAGDCDCETVALTAEEAEALRLKHLRGLEQTVAAKRMGVSQSTFQRVLSAAHRKVAEALTYGKIIAISEQRTGDRNRKGRV